jgi:exosortase/archaeosortase family protein
VLTDTASHPTPAVRFVLRAVAWGLGLFALLRLGWIDVHVMLPLTRAQANLAVHVFGTPAVPVEVTQACSGAEALALCLGAVLAYPVRWRARLSGAGGGAALILVLNTLRIGTLGRAAASPAWFDALHVYVWPAVLTVATVGYVFAWMRAADRGQRGPVEGAPHEPSRALRPRPTRRFVVLTVAFLLVFAAATPLYAESASVVALGGVIARVAAAILGVAGITAHAADNVLWTARGGFAVTRECISTPLIPVYLAAAVTFAATRRRLVVAVLATAPLFVGLGILRLLAVALPVVGSPLFFVHAFYQLLLGLLIVFLAAMWRHGGRAAPVRALAGAIAGVLLALLLGPAYTRAVASAGGVPVFDPQGAIAFLPGFQVALYVALWVAASVTAGWGRFFTGLGILGVTQAAGLFALGALATEFDVTPHVRDVRGWAVAGPVLVFAAVIHGARARR